MKGDRFALPKEDRTFSPPLPPPSSFFFPSHFGFPLPFVAPPPLMTCSYDLQLHGGSPLGIATLSTSVGIKSLPRSCPQDRDYWTRGWRLCVALREERTIFRLEDSKSPITRRKKKVRRRKEEGKRGTGNYGEKSQERQ